ncbi:NADH dehydrogenase [ubiquinone] 1 alpha subcomplex subunit 8-like [Gigantopelta aegis]|uniref:NADH dehydrogenase [ubiquinone] 1 alpha subcomplex subunit 8-like n=1 Tax=Gigantopelta aegis TaxID=1735272 RepID=UPI001B88CE80|nr:NADH dehydrogenase [ubiquinone] 1 alpha subcomplex subunit 8-like [Gigantopelta aegis]
MAFTNEDYLPSYEELTVPEIQLTSSVLRAGAHQFGKYCDNVCKEFMLCRKEEGDPRKCLNEGKEVTRCAFDFFGKVKNSCYEEFTNYWQCVDKSGREMYLKPCRKPQLVFDNCIRESLGQERPGLGYFSKVRTHDTNRPKPKLPEHKLPPRLPEVPPLPDEIDPQSKYMGSQGI